MQTVAMESLLRLFLKFMFIHFLATLFVETSWKDLKGAERCPCVSMVSPLLIPIDPYCILLCIIMPYWIAVFSFCSTNAHPKNVDGGWRWWVPHNSFTLKWLEDHWRTCMCVSSAPWQGFSSATKWSSPTTTTRRTTRRTTTRFSSHLQPRDCKGHCGLAAGQVGAMPFHAFPCGCIQIYPNEAKWTETIRYKSKPRLSKVNVC